MKKVRIEYWIAICTTILSIAATWYYYQADLVTIYGDAMAHMLISRRVVEGVTVGLAQMGSTWLPLPHVLPLPLIKNDFLYTSGLAGSIISMVSYVIACVYLYKTTFFLTGSKTSGVIATSFFALNGNILYMQSVPMTELLMICTMIMGVYHFMRWCEEESLVHLAASAASLFLSGLTRYEGWILTATIGILLMYVAWRKRYSWSKFESYALFWGSLAGLAILMWILWNAVIFGDPLDFQHGEYAKPGIWVSANDINIGNLKSSLLSYMYAMVHIMGLPGLAVAAVGLAIFLIRERLNSRSIGALAILTQIPFFVMMLYAGQRPLHVPEITGTMYNVRFALALLAPASIFIGYILVISKKLAYVLVPLVLLVNVLVYQQGIITLEEPAATQYVFKAPEQEWFRENYDGGVVLAENNRNEGLFFRSGVSLKNHIYEGTYRIWNDAIQDPLKYDVEWIVARNFRSLEDKVWIQYRSANSSEESKKLLSVHYDLVYKDEETGVEIYRRKDTTVWNGISALQK